MASKNNDIDTSDFATLFEKSMTRMEKLKPGQALETTVISISKDCVFLQLSGKSEGMIDRAEFTDKDGNLTVKEGDTIKAFFMGEKNGEMNFSTKINADKADPSMLENAYRNNIPVEGFVEKETKGGFEIKIGASRAFCPFSQMGQKRTDNAAQYVGKNMTFKIQEFKEGGRNILVSNRVLHEEERESNLQTLKKTLVENMLVKGKIKSIEAFGAFVDINGIQALLPISEISRNRIEDINTVLSVGQEIEAKILKIDWAKQRISVSMKSLLADPWDAVKDQFPADSKHTGKVVRITGFGAFVNLANGIDGLVHLSEMTGEDKHGNPKLSLKAGDTARVQVISVDADKRRISLKLAASEEEEATNNKYLKDNTQNEAESDSYNPFAALLKKK